jgi:uncharacterized protein
VGAALMAILSMIRPASLRLPAAALLTAVGALPEPSAMAQPQFPALTGRVVDGADVIPAAVEARLTQKLERLEQQSRRQFVVATVPSLQGYDIADYGYQLGRAWGIGDKARNDGVLLLVATTERKVRVETGYGLEGVLPDGMGFLIINKDIVPRFKAGDMPGGIEAGADAIIRQLTLPNAQAQQIAAQAKRRGEKHSSIPFVPIVLVLLILGFFILPVLNTIRGRGGRRRGGWGAPIVWSSGGGSGGGGSSSSGGFSGGGGSFGGGGASGSW